MITILDPEPCRHAKTSCHLTVSMAALVSDTFSSSHSNTDARQIFDHKHSR